VGAEEGLGTMGAMKLLLQSSRILIVDAYGPSREGLRDALRASGYFVDAVADAREAIQRAMDGQLGLAIIDLDLAPSRRAALDGWELAEVIRALHPEAALILVTAEWRPEFRAHAEGLHRAHLLEKPIHPRELRALVSALPGDGAAPGDDPGRPSPSPPRW
jgi:DNA-binding response OmpR family regulator